MKWLADNWSLLLVIAVIIVYFVIVGKKGIKEWLLYFVSRAEKELGSGTGQLKLRMVYDAFILRYPIFSKIIPFALFSLFVDNALKEMKKIIESNKAIETYISEEEK